MIKITDETFIEIIGKHVNRVELVTTNNAIAVFLAELANDDAKIEIYYSKIEGEVEIWICDSTVLKKLCGTVLILCEDTKYFQDREFPRLLCSGIGDKIAFEIIKRTDQGRHMKTTKI